METQDYPVRHFRRMAELAAGLKSIPAQLLDHEYSSQSFGSWWTTLRCHGVVFRIVYDGKEGVFLVQRSPSRKRPYDWDPPTWQGVPQPGQEFSLADLVEAVRAIATAG